VPFEEDGKLRWKERAGLTECMRYYGVPGVSFAVIEGYEIAWAKGHGTLRSNGDADVTPMTIFHAGSIAKVVSAAAFLKLVQEGRLMLDEDFIANFALGISRITNIRYARRSRYAVCSVIAEDWRMALPIVLQAMLCHST